MAIERRRRVSFDVVDRLRKFGVVIASQSLGSKIEIEKQIQDTGLRVYSVDIESMDLDEPESDNPLGPAQYKAVEVLVNDPTNEGGVLAADVVTHVIKRLPPGKRYASVVDWLIHQGEDIDGFADFVGQVIEEEFDDESREGVLTIHKMERFYEATDERLLTMATRMAQLLYGTGDFQIEWQIAHALAMYVGDKREREGIAVAVAGEVIRATFSGGVAWNEVAVRIINAGDEMRTKFGPILDLAELMHGSYADPLVKVEVKDLVDSPDRAEGWDEDADEPWEAWIPVQNGDEGRYRIFYERIVHKVMPSDNLLWLMVNDLVGADGGETISVSTPPDWLVQVY